MVILLSNLSSLEAVAGMAVEVVLVDIDQVLLEKALVEEVV